VPGFWGQVLRGLFGDLAEVGADLLWHVAHEHLAATAAAAQQGADNAPEAAKASTKATSKKGAPKAARTGKQTVNATASVKHCSTGSLIPARSRFDSKGAWKDKNAKSKDHSRAAEAAERKPRFARTGNQ
jgi:hypothetical protein